MGTKKILVTGGPVHTHLDAVKVITNKFRGGRIAQLAYDLHWPDRYEVTYMHSEICPMPRVLKGDVNPHSMEVAKKGFKDNHYVIKILKHSGFHDYMDRVLRMAPDYDAVVLGAAVANLIPLNPWEKKFPSHDYKPGDVIPIEFTIAPRVIDLVHKEAPKTHIFGFKLLSNAPHEELISAAYGVQQSSKATAVFANDTTDLSVKYAVTKERAVHTLPEVSLPEFIWDMMEDEYYRTEVTKQWDVPLAYTDDLKQLIEAYSHEFREVEGGYIFGTVAIRLNGGFVTTARGKRELDQWSYVHQVNHETRTVHAHHNKATLNAPLLASIFAENEKVQKIVHYHREEEGLPTYDYAPSGTVKDSRRENVGSSFNVKNHGCYVLLDAEGNVL